MSLSTNNGPANITPCMNSSSQKHLTSQTNKTPYQQPPPTVSSPYSCLSTGHQDSYRCKIAHKYCIFCDYNSYLVIQFLTIHIFNYVYILIFYNKKDPAYCLYIFSYFTTGKTQHEFNVYTDTPSKFTTHTYTDLIFQIVITRKCIFRILDCIIKHIMFQ